jgi:hypothetical protein
MTHAEAQAIATDNNLGRIHFQYNISKKTGQQFEVGYIFRKGEMELFCKRQPNTADDAFYLCNDFALLKGNS